MSESTKGSVPLHKSTTEANAVSWSQDQRIAVTSTQTVYVLTLKRPWSSPRGDVSAVHSGSNPAAVEGNPLLVISTAQAPLTEKLGPLSMGDVSRGMLTTYPAAAQWNLMDFVDPLLVGEGDSTHDLFKASHWSPAGYSHLGGCVLTTLTASGRLLLFTPPGNTGSSWKMALDLSSHHSSLLWPQSNPQANKGKGAKGKGGKAASADGSVNGNGVNGNGVPDKPPRPKRSRLSSKTGLSEEYRQRRLSVACSVGSWLPTLLLVHREVIGIIAVATRTGHVTLLGVKLPVVLGKMKEDPVSLICDYQLPLMCDGEETAWACSLTWLPSSSVAQTTPTFYMSPSADGLVHAQLAVGCTNGQVFSVRWELSGVNGIIGLVSSSISSLNGVTGVCSISGVTGVTGCVGEAVCLWEESDGVPVCCIASQPNVSMGR